MLNQSQRQLFTIVIPSYNRANSIARTIKSVLAQTYNNLELIIIDDGSKDNTKAVVQEYLTDSRVRYIYQENAGAQEARNHGLRESNGKYILFLDSDDELLSSFTEKVVQKFESDDFGAVYCLTGIHDKNGNMVPARNDYLDGNCYKEVLLQGYLTSTSFIAFKKSCFDVVGNWDKAFPASQDDDMCFRFAKNYKIGLIPEILGIYYLDGGNQIGSSQRRVAIGWWTLWNKYEEDIVSLCGEKRIIECYADCLKRFMTIKDVDLIESCKEKLLKYIPTSKLKKIITEQEIHLFGAKLKHRIKLLITENREL